MVKMSTKGRYGLRALVDLAILHEKTNKSVALKEIATRQDISIKYLEALFNMLKSAGIIKSQRGAGGGYFLSDDPANISSISVVEAIEGPISLVDCCIERSFCKNIGKCKTVSLWQKINDKIVDELKNTTIRDLM
jgi:Rrf2 family protein